MVSCTRQLAFDAGHRLVDHEGKCASLHGHRYVVEITCSPLATLMRVPVLDGVGRVVDFSVIKELVGGWIDEHWDHTLILRNDDPLLILTQEEISDGVITMDTVRARYVFGPRQPFIMDVNPTAENMAAHLYMVANNLLKPYGIRVTYIRLYETPNCWADFVPDPLTITPMHVDERDQT